MHLLVFRFSAMGDVALTVPVIRNVLKHNEDLHITLVTNPNFTSFFFGIDRLTIFPADFKKKYQGINGLFRLYKDLKSDNKFDYLVDLHSVVRSWILTFLFSLSGLKFFRIKKDRKNKKKIVTGKSTKPLIHTIERYQKVFEKIIPVRPLPTAPSIFPSGKALSDVELYIEIERISLDKQWIGIAPMAKHELKRWGISNTQKLIELIKNQYDVHFFLFGGGKKEKEILEHVADQNSYITNVTGKLNMSKEIALISKMSFMLTMDSGNMHISSLLGVPTISIWGATHPKIGFGALNQPEKYSIQIPESELNCRPCSIYGKGSCKRGDKACLTWIKPESVLHKLQSFDLL